MRLSLLTADIGNPTRNLGDYFITKAIAELLSEHELLRVPMHVGPDKHRIEQLRGCDALIICGTNIVGENGSVRMAYRPEDFERIGKPVIPLGLGSQADRGKSVSIDEQGRALLKYWLQSSGPLSVRDPLTADLCERELGKGSYQMTGCPSLFLRANRFAAIEPRLIFCPGPFHYRAQGLDRSHFLETTGQIYASMNREAPTLYLAQQQSDFEFRGPLPGVTSLHSPHLPDLHLRAIASAQAILSFRIHPCLTGVSFGVPSFLLSLDERTKSLALSLGIPFLDFTTRPSLADIEEAFRSCRADYPWKEIEQKRSELQGLMVRHLEEKGLGKSKTLSRSNPLESPLRIACISDSSFLPSAIGLIQNLLDQHSGPLRCHLLALDLEVSRRLPNVFAQVNFTFYSMEDLWNPSELLKLRKRNTAEQAYSSKSRLLEKALEREAAPLFFLDLDLWFSATPNTLLCEFKKGQVLLFPHSYDVPSHASLFGRFNSGIVGVKPKAEGFLRWWAHEGIVNWKKSVTSFYEQSFLDEAPLRFPEVVVYEGETHNVGPWSIRSLGIHGSSETPWILLDKNRGPVLSYHAAQHDKCGFFEAKFAWDAVVTFFSPLPQSFYRYLFQNSCFQQGRHWPALGRVVFLFETLHYRCNFSRVRLSRSWVLWMVQGGGRMPMAWIAVWYGRFRAFKRKAVSYFQPSNGLGTGQMARDALG